MGENVHHCPDPPATRDLLPALGRLIARAAERSQIIVVSHANRVIATLEEARDCHSIVLEKRLGETRLADEHMSARWQWPVR